MKIGKKALSLVLSLAMITGTFMNTTVFASSTVVDSNNWHYNNVSDPEQYIDSNNAWTDVKFQQENWELTQGGGLNFSNYLKVWKVGGPTLGEKLSNSANYIVPGTWESTNTDAVTVDQNGKVTASSDKTGSSTVSVQVKGTHRVTAGEHKDSNVYATWTVSCNVTVKQADVIPANSISIKNAKNLIVGVGRWITLEATVDPEDVYPTWSSGDESIATVNNSGVVTGVKAGTVTITAKAGDKTATCTVKVIDAQYDLSMQYDYDDYKNADYSTDEGIAIDKNGLYLFTWHAAADTVTWSSTQPDVASVDENGVVKGLKAGRTFIVATCSGKKVYFKVSVDDYQQDANTATRENATGVGMLDSSKSITLYVGKQDGIVVNYTRDGFEAGRIDDADKSFSSSDTDVATVNQDGVVTGVGKGTAKITVTVKGTANFSDITYTSDVTVLDTESKSSVYYNYTGTDFTSSQLLNFTIDQVNHTRDNAVYFKATGSGLFDTSKESVYFKVQCEPNRKYIFKAFAASASDYDSYELIGITAQYDSSTGAAVIKVPMKLIRMSKELTLRANDTKASDLVWTLNHGQTAGTIPQDYLPYVGVYQHSGDKVEICKDGAVKFCDNILNKGDLEEYEWNDEQDVVDNGYGKYSNAAYVTYNMTETGAVTLDRITIHAVNEAGAHWDTNQVYYYYGDFDYDADAKTLTYTVYDDDYNPIKSTVFTYDGGSSGDNGGNNNNSSNNSNSSGNSTPAANTPANTAVTTNPNGGTTATVSTQPDTAPVVTGNQSKVTVTVPADVASIISSATAQKPAEVKVSAPTASLVEQLKNDAVKTVDLTISVPPVVANNTNANAKVTINVEPAVLQAAKDAKKDVTIEVVNSQTGNTAYSWTFSGTSLNTSAASLTNVNLAITVVPAKNDAAAAAVAAGNTSDKKSAGIVLNFAHSGLLPSTASVRVYVGDQPGGAPSSKLYMYYFNQNTKTLEQLSQSEFTVDALGYVTVPISHCSEYVLLSKPATNAYPVKSDTMSTVGVKNGKTYTYAMTVSGKAVPSFTVGNSKAFTVTVKRAGNKYYVTIKAAGAAGTMTAVYSTLPKQKSVIMGYVAVAK